MADRTVYGNNFSENGWRMVDTGSCVWVAVPGTKVHLQIREGQPAAILGAFAADFNAYVEPLRDADSACWTGTNSVATSNHLSGTGMDLNWNGPDGRTFRFQIPKERAYPGQKSVELDKLLDFYEGIVFCGGEWSIRDWMHMQLGANTYGSANVGKVQNFIARKIRADGYSTYRRANNPAPPPPPVTAPPASNLSRAEGYALRIINEGRKRGVTPKGIQIALATAIVESNITVYANEKLPRSLQLPHDAVGRDGLSVGIFQQQVKDTGSGWWWGDEKTCMGVESSAGLFYDRLVRLPYNGTSKSPGAFAQEIQRSAYPGRYDENWGKAVALYNKLAGIAPPTQGDDEVADADLVRKIDALYQEFTKRFTSRSPLRHVGEGPLDTLAGFVLNTDGNQHVDLVARLAGYKDPDALALLEEVANNTERGREHDAKLAQAILAETAEAEAREQAVTWAGQPVDAAPQQIVYRDVAATSAPYVAPEVHSTEATTGQIIGEAYDALEKLQASGVLNNSGSAPLVSALISVLETKTEEKA